MAKNIITSSTLKRVFHIRVGNSGGTAFIVNINEKNYLITARHMFEETEYQNQMNIYIQYEDTWKSVPAKIYYHPNTDIDMAVVVTEFFKDKQFGKINYKCRKLRVSQDVFMLGFPYGLSSNVYDINEGYPIPFVKKGIFSGLIRGKTAEQYYIAWDNNQGFSGGPVVYRPIINDEYSEEEYIAGVIHGYCPHKIEIRDEDGNDTGMFAQENSGIGIMYEIERAMEIIEKINEL